MLPIVQHPCLAVLEGLVGLVAPGRRAPPAAQAAPCLLDSACLVDGAVLEERAVVEGLVAYSVGQAATS